MHGSEVAFRICADEMLNVRCFAAFALVAVVQLQDGFVNAGVPQLEFVSLVSRIIIHHTMPVHVTSCGSSDKSHERQAVNL